MIIYICVYIYINIHIYMYIINDYTIINEPKLIWRMKEDSVLVHQKDRARGFDSHKSQIDGGFRIVSYL